VRDQIQKFTKTAAENYTEANDRILDVVVETNRKVVDFAVKAADQVVEQLEQIDQLPDFKFAERLPTPAETGARYIEFVERAAEMNRDFTQRVVANLLAGDPVAPAVEKPAAEGAPAKKAPAKKSTARKSTAKKAAAKRSAASS
jgi:hypothetical protein